MRQDSRPASHFKSLYSYTPRKPKSGLSNFLHYKTYFRKNSIYFWMFLGFSLFSILFYIGYFYVVKSTLFRISTVQIVGTSKFVSDVDLQRVVLQNLEGDYIFQVDEVSLAKVFKQSFLGIKEVTFTKDFPNTVIVHVIEREPLAIVFNPKDYEHYLVDIEGYILGTVSPEYNNLPEVIYHGPLHVGGFIDKDLIPLYLSLISSIENTELKASSISIEKRSIDFYVNEKTQVYLNKQKSVPESIKIIDQLFTQLSLEGKNINRIDLRYDKVVVEYDED